MTNRAAKTLTVAFQGEKGAFSQVAIHQLLGPDVEPKPCQHFEQVFQSLARRKVDAAVIPIENTLHGSVHENYDHLVEFRLPIVGETSVRIVHNVIALPGVRFSQLKRIFSHPVALNQCLKFFARFPHLERVPFYDTAGSVKMLIERQYPDAAAIASAAAAEIYGGRILRRSIEDDRQNFTRFFLLRRRRESAPDFPPDRGGAYKTSLVFSTRNIPGSLFRALSAFALRDVNLAKIESRPLRGKPWEYLFYVDLIGHISDEKVRNALNHLRELADFITVLGCYPRGH
ncbi:MAG: prephenate dehydratase [Bryobacteraceae bacterium]|nr:prephenate dehydratase [Bryobacteraceae bacterium]